MLPLVYLVSLAALAVALAARGVDLGQREEIGLRLSLGFVALLFGVVGVAGLAGLQEEPAHSGAVVSLGHLVYGSLCLGGVAYAIGALSWRGTAPLCLRATGWSLMVLAVAVPSQLTFGLPLLSLLAVSVRRVEGTWTAEASNGHAPSPRKRHTTAR